MSFASDHSRDDDGQASKTGSKTGPDRQGSTTKRTIAGIRKKVSRQQSDTNTQSSEGETEHDVVNEDAPWRSARPLDANAYPDLAQRIINMTEGEETLDEDEFVQMTPSRHLLQELVDLLAPTIYYLQNPMPCKSS